jgi:hypothetical protein
MEVNKTLMEDRIHILSNNKVNIDDVEETFVLGEEDLSNA